MKYAELFVQVTFAALIFGMPLVLLFALFCELFGWYDAKGHYNGPFSKARRK